MASQDDQLRLLHILEFISERDSSASWDESEMAALWGRLATPHTTHEERIVRLFARNAGGWWTWGLDGLVFEERELWTTGSDGLRYRVV